MIEALEVPRAAGPFRIERPDEKLRLRGSLPGAYGYDLAADALRRARAAGVPAATLLPCAMPGSWMVNAKASSPVFRRWLSPPLADVFALLVDRLSVGPHGWLDTDDAERADVTEAVALLSVDGQGPCAVSKVLALLCPELVPLMDDAAIALALGKVPMPDTADKPTAPPDLFVPMLDWFAHAVVAREPDLVELAKGYPLATLDAAQVLDRLWWFSSWGHRHFEKR